MRDEDFIARVRRHKPSALLPLIAQFASTRILSDDWMKRGQRGFGSPWALAEIARVSLAYGNEHRKHATFQDLIACNDAYNELDDPEMVKGFNGPVTGFFLRMCEQLEYQLPARHEMTRALAFFKFTEPRRPLRVVRDGWDTELLGVDLVSYIAAGEMLHFAAKPNQGRFNPRWLDQPNFDFLRDVIDPDLLRTAWNHNYVIDASEFAAQNARPRPSVWRRYGHNALLSRPVVRGVHEDWLISVPGLIVRRLSPLGLYYAGVEHWGKAFADDLGDLFEPYVGSHLRLLGTDVIEPGFTYGRSGSTSRRSPVTARPTVRSPASSCSCCGSGSPTSPCSSAPSSTPRLSAAASSRLASRPKRTSSSRPATPPIWRRPKPKQTSTSTRVARSVVRTPTTPRSSREGGVKEAGSGIDRWGGRDGVPGLSLCKVCSGRVADTLAAPRELPCIPSFLGIPLILRSSVPSHPGG